jgi:hypothetical protein
MQTQSSCVLWVCGQAEILIIAGNRYGLHAGIPPVRTVGLLGNRAVRVGSRFEYVSVSDTGSFGNKPNC